MKFASLSDAMHYGRQHSRGVSLVPAVLDWNRADIAFECSSLITVMTECDLIHS